MRSAYHLQQLAATAVGLLLLGPQQAPAAQLSLTAFGHPIEIVRTKDGDKLTVDGRTFHQNWILSIDETAVVGGLGVLIGSSSAGGNACAAAPFVISFPSGKPPRFDGPLATCSVASRTVQDRDVVFETAALPGAAGERWSWTLESGFVQLADKPFTIDRGKGWADLRERKVEHPSELMRYGEIAQQVDALLGKDRDAFLDIVRGTGGGSFVGDSYVGSACIPHMCAITEALVVADISVKRVFLAWKPEGKPIVVRPSLPDWSPTAQSAFLKWKHGLR